MNQSTDGRLAVITCHFNWGGFSRPVQNLHRFIREMMKDGVPVYGAEAHVSGTPSRMKGNPNWKTIECSERCVMFQKEALLNIAETLVPPQYDMIAWIDADMFFINPEWPQLTEKALQDYKIIQPFETACWTGRLGGVIRRRWSVGRYPLDKNWISHPGFAWAAHREMFRIAGLYPYAIVGSGDTLMACAALDIPVLGKRGYGTGVPNMHNGVFHEWKYKFTQFMCGGKIGFIPGNIYHEYHGSLKDRNYVNRASFIQDYDALNHSFINKDGLVEWKNSAPKEMVKRVYDYFTRDRNEDDSREKTGLSTVRV